MKECGPVGLQFTHACRDKLTCLLQLENAENSDHRPRPHLLLSKFQTMNFTGHYWLKLKMTLYHYVLDGFGLFEFI